MRKLILVNLIGNLVGLAVGVVLAGMLIQSIHSADATLEEIHQFSAVQQHAADIRLQMIAMSDAMRGYLLDTSTDDNIAKKQSADDALVEAVAGLLASTRNQQFIDLAKQVGDLDERTLDRIEDAVLELAKRDRLAATRSYFADYLPVRTEQMAIVEQLQQLARDGYADRVTAVQRERAATLGRLAWLCAAALMLMAVAVGWSLWTAAAVRRQLDTQTAMLTTTADEVLGAAQEVSGTAQALSQGVVEQAASLEETSASMKDVAEMTRQNAESARSAAQVMTRVEAGVSDSNRAVEGMRGAMATIQDSSRRVAQIVKTIDEIAFQTNILALNAAVEAARAGESGLSFAVVADEVRNLAQRSATAARDTAALIEASMATTKGGSEKLAQVATSIAAMTGSVAEVKGLVDTMSRASEHQAQGSAQISQALSQMEQVTHATSATAERSAASSDALTGQARSARLVAARLNELVGHSERAAPLPVLVPRAA